MDDNKEKKIDNDVHIEQLNPKDELNELEKTAILQFKIEQEELKKEEELSRTKQFKILNTKNKSEDLDLPKKTYSLGDTIKLKLSDLRTEIDDNKNANENKDNKKSLYDTVIIKLDDLINNKRALKLYTQKKVTSIEDSKIKNTFSFFKPKDITKDLN